MLIKRRKFFTSDWLSLSSLFLSAFLRQLKIQLRSLRCKEQICARSNHIMSHGPLRKLRTSRGKRLVNGGKPFGFRSITSAVMIRILFCLLLSAEVVDVGHHFLQAVDPLLSLLLRAGHEVQVLAAALEHDGEAAALHLLLCVLFQALWLTAYSDCWYVIEWNWGQKLKLLCYT